MYGHPADMDPLMNLARAHNLIVIEDAAHALGSRYRGRMTGTIGHLAIFSTGRKHITTGGIGGMVTTNNGEWAERIDRLRNHGRDEREQRDLRQMDRVTLLGFNYRQSEVLAALGELQVQQLPPGTRSAGPTPLATGSASPRWASRSSRWKSSNGRSTATFISRFARRGGMNWPHS